MTSKNSLNLRPGEINLSFLPIDWPLTPLGPNKGPYLQGWQNNPLSVKEIETELASGNCKAIGLLGGPVYNYPYGLVWVDVDGPSVRSVVEELAGTTFDLALPQTLTICSGKEGRERKLYRLEKEKYQHFVRNKYTWHSEENKEKLEILWRRHQGVLMGLHPETEGYFTAPEQGFEWVDQLPEMPDWLLNAIISKNVKVGVPATENTRVVGPGFAITQRISVDRDMRVAVEAMWGMPPEAADDYDIWITVGQSLHSLDESLLDEWDKWSQQSSKYTDGECLRRWLSFTKGGGRGVGSIVHLAKQNGWKESQEYKAFSPDNEMLEHAAVLLQQLEEEYGVVPNGISPGKPSMSYVVETNDNKKEKEGKVRNPASNVITDILLQEYKGNLRFSKTHNQFFVYEYKGKGLWSPLSKIEMLADIRDRLTELGSLLPKGFTSNLMNDIFTQLQASLTFDEWYHGSQYLLFNNGVLDVETKQLLPFERSLYLTQQMPYDYDPAATCEDIIVWLKHTQHNSWERTQVLRAWLRAVLLGCYEIQRFVEIVGPGKSGKSTYANLAVALVGKQNTYSTDFENLEKNRFEAVGYMGKKLLLFQDADRWGGSVSKLKAITGSDWIRNERKYQGEDLDPFQFRGMVMITANEAIQSTDYTSGLARRRLTVPFDRPYTGGANEQKELVKFNHKGEVQGVFAPLMPGLVNWLLDMTEEDMRTYLMETSTKVKFFKKYEKTQNLRSNPLLDWLEHKVVYDPGVASPIGVLKNSSPGSQHFYSNYDKWLYASYAEFCRQCNVGTLSRGRFEPLLLDICLHQLKLNVYGFKAGRGGMRVANIAVAEANPDKYQQYPSIVEVATDKDKYRELYGDKLDASDEVRED